MEPLGNAIRDLLPSLIVDDSLSSTSTSTRCPTCMDTGWVRVPNLALSDPRFGKAQECTACTVLHDRRVTRSLAHAGFPPEFEAATFETYPITEQTQATVAQLRSWTDDVSDYAAKSVLLHGENRVGKTGLAVSMARRRVELLGVPMLFVTAPVLLDGLRPSQDGPPSDSEESEKSLWDRVKAVPILILDDLGAEKLTEWVQERLFVLVNHRHDYRLTTIFTSNEAPKGLASRLGRRTGFRLVEMCLICHLTGPRLKARS